MSILPRDNLFGKGSFPSWWWRFSLLVVIGLVLYVFFWAVDGQFLAAQAATATVTAKEHQPAKTTYRMDRVGNVNRAVPQAVPDLWILTLRIGDQDAQHAVDNILFEQIKVGDKLRAQYEKRRLTGSLKVISVERELAR